MLYVIQRFIYGKKISIYHFVFEVEQNLFPQRFLSFFLLLLHFIIFLFGNIPMMLSFSFFILTYYTLHLKRNQKFSAHASFHSFMLCIMPLLDSYSLSLSSSLYSFRVVIFCVGNTQRTHKYVPARAMIDSKT